MGSFALDETVQDLGIDLGDVGELDLVHLGAFSAGGGGLVGQSNIELLTAGVELEPVDGKDVLAAIVHTARGEARRVCCESMKVKVKTIAKGRRTSAAQCRIGDDE